MFWTQERSHFCCAIQMCKTKLTCENRIQIQFNCFAVCSRLMPLDWRTPFGYLMAWIAQFAGLLVVVLATISLYSLIFASCWLFVTIADDITQELVAFNIDVRISDGTDHDELMRYFCDIVQLYSDAKQWVRPRKLCLRAAQMTYFWFQADRQIQWNPSILNFCLLFVGRLCRFHVAVGVRISIGWVYFCIYSQTNFKVG